MPQPLFRRLSLRNKTSTWASNGPAATRSLAREEQLGRYTTDRAKYYRLYLYSGKVTLAPMYLRRFRVVRRSFTAGAPPLTQALTDVTPPAPAGKKLGAGLKRLGLGQTCGGMLGAMTRIAPARSAQWE
jgi:hypothetical protein